MISTASIWSLTLDEFVQASSSKDPVPGGGSVSMVSAALGTALIAMAMEVSRDKSENKSQYDILLSELGVVMNRMREIAELDIEAFSNFMTALKLPKVTDDDKLKRRAALHDATLEATKIPLSGGDQCVAALVIANRAYPICVDQILSDIYAGVHLVYGALNAVLTNVDANCKSLPHEFGDSFRQRRLQIETEAISLIKGILPGIG